MQDMSLSKNSRSTRPSNFSKARAEVYSKVQVDIDQEKVQSENHTPNTEVGGK